MLINQSCELQRTTAATQFLYSHKMLCDAHHILRHLPQENYDTHQNIVKELHTF